MDLIDRQAAIDAIERNAYRHTYIDQIVDIIKELPSAQPEIIRCKECKEFRRYIDTDITFCDRTECERKPEDFCSFAERRPDGN